MGTFGGLAPHPRRFGGRAPTAKVLFQGLAADRGTALDATNTETVVYAETVAIARAVAGTWATNERVSKAWQPLRCPLELLERWEQILVLPPRVSDTEKARRERLAEHFARFGEALEPGLLEAKLSAAVPDAFVDVEYISVDDARILVPDGSYPFGSVGGVPWNSTVAHVLVRLQKPSGWSEGQFYDAAAEATRICDANLPAWASFDWYRPGATSTDLGGDGPSAAGFYLDEDGNLDNQILDE